MMEFLQRIFGGSGSNTPTSSSNSGGIDLSNKGTAFNQSPPQQTPPSGTDFHSMMEKLKQGRKRRLNPAPPALDAGGTGQVIALRQLLNNMIGPR